ncbi:M16 family metallopeptidase [Clostridium manihotivorum]|uniref:Peptidase M16 n=1 Tax=Clostridium manihotivorum TaxID=2320868 RepID=A0A3R5U578_9CLOT|nr:pitrilysin family protein [Clostridium manihotivorum]QAA31940.1 peptidase M16 [Clostridium manihotivorum]
MYRLNLDSNTIKLENGLTIITVKKETQLASINVGVKVGSLNEGIKEKGVAHFIEHMLFKGTKTRDNKALNDELEFLGGEYNAYTDYCSTVYGVTCLHEEIVKAIELLADMVIASTFDKEELEKERGVILAEIKTSKDDIEDLSFKRINEIAFEHSPLRYEISGDEESVGSFTREDLVDFYKRFYTPDNTVITIVSSYDHDEAISILSKYFGNWSGKLGSSSSIAREKNKEVTLTTYKRDIELSTITYLYTLDHIAIEEELALKILNHKFGESANSILFRELREERGLAYDVYTNLDLGKDIKTLYIFTSVEDENIEEALDAIDDCIEKIKLEEIPFPKSTIELMKKVHKTAVVSTLDDSAELSSYVLNQVLEGEPIDEFIHDMERLNHIENIDLYNTARKVFNKPTIHILRADKEAEEIDE